jgi:nucleoside permease NupC
MHLHSSVLVIVFNVEKPTVLLNTCDVLLNTKSEAPLIIKPLLNNMTNSELHAVMAGGMATIAGSVMASYILFGVSIANT